MFSTLKQWNSLAMFEKEEDKRMARIQLHIIAFNCFLSLLVLIINLTHTQENILVFIVQYITVKLLQKKELPNLKP